MSHANLRTRLAHRLAAFWNCKRGNIAMLFGLSLVPLTLTAGTGLDLARAMVVRSQIAEALDAAALAVGGTSNMTQAQRTTLAQQYFNANYKVDPTFGTPSAVSVVVSGQSVTVSSGVTMPTTLLKALNIPSLVINESSKVVWGNQKLWVSIVLDNSGSMSETDASGTSKISALRTATKQLLTMLQNASPTAGDVKAAIIPFSVSVNVKKSNLNESWIDWTMWEQAPANATDTATSTEWKFYGPKGKKDVCPWTVSNNGYRCQVNSTNGSSTYGSNDDIDNGMFCPTVDDGSENDGWDDRYYNGCFNSVKVKSNCNNNCEYTHTWVPNARGTWNGCVADRTQPYDAQNTAPTTTATKFPAENARSGRCIDIEMTQGLLTNWTTLNNKADDMEAGGSTNQAIGLAWGWKMLTQGAPFAPGTLPDGTSRVIILLSDGVNTRNRWGGNGSSQYDGADDRMAATCANAKADGVTIYTVLVQNGNADLLRNCASDTGKYFALTSGSQIANAFTQIGQQITNLRVAQ